MKPYSMKSWKNVSCRAEADKIIEGLNGKCATTPYVREQNRCNISKILKITLESLSELY